MQSSVMKILIRPMLISMIEAEIIPMFDIVYYPSINKKPIELFYCTEQLNNLKRMFNRNAKLLINMLFKLTKQI